MTLTKFPIQSSQRGGESFHLSLLCLTLVIFIYLAKTTNLIRAPGQNSRARESIGRTAWVGRKWHSGSFSSLFVIFRFGWLLVITTRYEGPNLP